MFLLGHTGFAVLLLALFSLPFIWGILGSQMPDLIDKPLLLLDLGPTGRYLGHTLLSCLTLALIFHISAKNLKKTLAFIVGYISHFIGDLYDVVPIFYPFKHYEFIDTVFSFKYTTFFLVTDAIGLLIIIIVYWKNKRFRDELKGFISSVKKTLSNISI